MQACKKLVAVLLMLGTAAVASAQLTSDTMAWLFKELSGTWQQTSVRQGAVQGAATPKTSLSHLGGGVFRVNTSERRAPLARWNGKQVRVSGPLSTDAQGWTYFQLGETQSRIGLHRNGRKILEIGYNDRATFLELEQAPR